MARSTQFEENHDEESHSRSGKKRRVNRGVPVHAGDGNSTKPEALTQEELDLTDQALRRIALGQPIDDLFKEEK
jgi:hypothetical protein